VTKHRISELEQAIALVKAHCTKGHAFYDMYTRIIGDYQKELDKLIEESQKQDK